jgi:hypothetical protein
VTVEEELRADHPEEPLEVDDVLRAEQPAIVNFIQEHIDAVLESGDDLDVTGRDVAGPGVDVDDLQRVYRHVYSTFSGTSTACLLPDLLRSESSTPGATQPSHDAAALEYDSATPEPATESSFESPA